MSTQVYEKRCPTCGKTTALDKAQCDGCGRVFKTRFAAPATPAPPAEQTLAVPRGWSPPLNPGARRSRAPAVTAAIVALVIVGALFSGALLVGAAFRARRHARVEAFLAHRAERQAERQQWRAARQAAAQGEPDETMP